MELPNTQKQLNRPKARSESLLRKGFALHQQGMLEAAVAIYKKALALSPNSFQALQLLGVAYGQTGDFVQAASFLSKAVKIDSNDAVVQNNLGNALSDLNRFSEALVSYDKAIALKPNYIEAHSRRANILSRLGRFEAALAGYDQLLAIQSDVVIKAEIYNKRAIILTELNRFTDALASYDKAIALSPSYVTAYINYGITLARCNRFDEALVSYDKAIVLKPDYVDTHRNRADALRGLNRFEEALISYDRAIALDPDHAGTHNKRGLTLLELRRLDAALISYQKAIAIQADYALAHFNLAMTYLMMGNFKDGWREYEWRWRDPQAIEANAIKKLTQPLWLGNASLQGKKILIYAEQGLGDAIQFCRYIPLVAKLGATVFFQVHSSVRPLLDSLAGVYQFVAPGDKCPKVDYQCPLLSLPLAFKTELSNIPDTPTLNHNKEKLARWAVRLGKKTKPRVGLAWSGSELHNNDHNRSLTLAQLLPYLPPNCEYISLQKDIRASDQTLLTAHTEIQQFGDKLEDFSDTGALCELTDVVISVDTSVAHLSATLQQKTWLLLPCKPDWRWLLDRSDSPWYRSAILYRQDTTRKWEPVLEKVKSSLLSIKSSHQLSGGQ